jgi:vacuolar-type H+-ATPase subunit D/Vma8
MCAACPFYGGVFQIFVCESHFWFEIVVLSIPVSVMASTSSILDQVVADMKAMFDRQVEEREEIYQRRISELEALVRHRDRRIEDLQELVNFRDADIKLFVASLRECHTQIDRILKGKRLLEKERDDLQQRVDDLERRPKPMPCGLPNLTRAALDQVMKWDADCRVTDQKQTICSLGRTSKHLQKENAALEDRLAAAEDTIKELRSGEGIRMQDFWSRFEELYLVETVSEESTTPEYDPTENIFQFIRRLILEIQEAEDEEEDVFAFSSLLPRIDPAFSAE